MERPLNELENECKTDEDRAWLAENIVASTILSLWNLFNIKSIWRIPQFTFGKIHVSHEKNSWMFHYIGCLFENP